ncbi:MAG: RNA-binding S4 domain-containing protein [Actinobacteria bacterium]|nr:RNA-binding S4 domain-containing protein [Actinomycetota bacterium]
MVLSGGEAKVVIADGLVMVNGEPETRRGRKLSSGDVIELNGARAEVAVRSRDTGPHSAC